MGCLFAQDSFESRTRALCHPEFGCEVAPWWPDEDGDGWGDGAFDAVLAEMPPAEHANNRLDCDDENPSTTGRTRGLCPADFGAQVVEGEAEDEVVWADLGTAAQAAVNCGDEVGWGGRLGVPLPSALPPSFVGWVAESPGELGPAWDGFLGADTLAPDAPVQFDGGLQSGSIDTSLPYLCSRPAPDPADWYTRLPEDP